MTKYDNMQESKESPKLLTLLLLGHSCSRYEYYSIIDFYHFPYFVFHI